MDIRKRYIISSILTSLALIFTNKYWYVCPAEFLSPPPRCFLQNIDILLFIIIAVIVYLLSLKITSYLADFNNIKKQSRTDIIFLLVFFLVLFIPMLKINQEKISKEENRTLAVYKPLLKKGKINYDFGKDFNNWFSDRFYLRKNMIEAQETLNYIISKQAKNGFIDAETGFMFMDWEFKHYNMDIIKKNFKELYRLNDFCKNNDIKLYILITPQRTDIYNPSKSKYITNDENHNSFLSYIKELQNKNELKVIYPYKELKNAAKTDYMFFKTEHHWSDDGAYIGYSDLMKEIKKDYPYIKSLSKNDYDFSYNKKIRGDFNRKFDLGTTGNRIHIPRHFQKKYHNVNYRYYKHKNFNNLKTETVIKNPKRQKSFYYPDGEDLKVVMLGTSQNENLTEFIPFTFKHTLRMRLSEGKDKYKYMKYYKDKILKFKPDIIIYCIVYSEISQQNKLFAEE